MGNISFRNARHIDKAFYLGQSEWFYEPNYVHYRPKDELISLVRSMIEARGSSWHLHRADVWTHVIPSPVNSETTTLPKQGWKIHISATNNNCREILERTTSIALENLIQFKFANDIETLRMMTSKRWPRGGSGKFITMYPRSDKEFQEIIEYAYLNLQDHIGSYILSDRRYKDCRCLYYRYGGIMPTTRADYTGRKLEVLTSPEGEEIVDQRHPYYELPHWVSDFIPQEASDQNDASLNAGRYEVTRALAFSNTGGVYTAVDTATGKEVVIKEARPCVELRSDGKDATDSLAREAKILTILGETGVSPRVLDKFWDWENFYVAEEYLDAKDLRQMMISHTPLLLVHPTQDKSAEFYRVYKAVFISLLRAVDRIHAAGVVIGDLSPMNVLVKQDDLTVRIIDLEGAFQPGLDDTQDLHTPGFRGEVKGRKKESSFRDDIYAVGAIMMYSIFPIAAMAYIRTDLFSKVLPIMIADVGWSNTPVLHVIQRLVGNTVTCREAMELLEGEATIQPPLAQPLIAASAPPLTEICDGLARFIVDNYRLKEPYTLFPIDPYGRQTNPLGFAFGATGIIYSLLKCGFDVPSDAMRRYLSEIETVPANTAPGFLVGSAGMAWALMAINDVDAGRRFLQHANASPLARTHHSLYYGMAGIGMANLAAFIKVGEQGYLDTAVGLAETLASTAVESERGLHWQHDGAVWLGLGYGQSGVALFLLRLSQVLKESRWREMGIRALEYDLSFGVEVEPGVISFGESPEKTDTLEPYIEQGSGGIAKVAIRYGMWDRASELLADAHRKYSVLPGLLYGLTSLVDVLTDAYIYSRDKKYLEMAERPLRGLTDLYLFESGRGYAAPGDNLFRISSDYATGLAGIMHTLHRRTKLIQDELCLDMLDSLQDMST